jgi:hypothetical protein
MIYTPTLTFVIDPKYDEEMILQMCRSTVHSDINTVARNASIDCEDVQRLLNADESHARKIASSLVRNRYSLLDDKLIITRDLYQRSWNEINNKFFGSVAQIMEHGWEYQKYECVVSAFHRGISNWNGNIIGRIWSENPYFMLKVTGHELILAQTFALFRIDETLRRLNLDDRQKWEIGEMAAWCMTGLDNKLITLWPWLTKAQLFPKNHNYQALVNNQVNLASIYSNYGFKNFLARAIEITNQ